MLRDDRQVVVAAQDPENIHQDQNGPESKSWYNPGSRRIPQETLNAHDLPMAMLDRRNEFTTELLTVAL